MSTPSILYGLAELTIGIGAFAVPALFAVAERTLLATGASGSGQYLLLSALAIVGAILPWCVMMGTTFPLMMAYISLRGAGQNESFSYLYLANVIGAMCGTLASALVLIELFGFATTSLIAAMVNGTIAIISFLLPRAQATMRTYGVDRIDTDKAKTHGGRWRLLVLFTTGFSSLAMEVVWTRAFTIVLHTTIYAFAAVLATYLLATWIGSAVYRSTLRRGITYANDATLALASIAALLPVMLNDPHAHSFVNRTFSFLPYPSILMVLGSIAPFCAVLGYLTPKLVDEYSRGDPHRAGRCYAVNILGGILGPLIAGYLIVPQMDVRYSLIVFALPIAALVAVAGFNGSRNLNRLRMGLVGCLAISVGVSRSYEEIVHADKPRLIRRDYVATVIAYGEGMGRQLLVNGVSMTHLTPITKVMAHLPLAMLHGKGRDGLVICFWNRHVSRAMASWGIDATAVDLVPSVPKTFAFFHADAPQVVANPNVHIVTDDGRRFLLRTNRMFDVIVIDAPPPVEAAG